MQNVEIKAFENLMHQFFIGTPSSITYLVLPYFYLYSGT